MSALSLLHFDRVARVNLLRDASDDGDGGTTLDVQYDQFADDLARDGRALVLDRRRLDGRAVLAAVHVLDALRLVGESAAAQLVALEAAARVGRDLVAVVDDCPVSRRAEDGQVVARTDVVLRAEVYEDDRVAREHLAPVARENDVSGLLAGRLGEAVEVHFGAARRDVARRNGAQHVAEQHVAARECDLGHGDAVAHAHDAKSPERLRVDAERTALARELRAEPPARARDLELLPDPHALLRARVYEDQVALAEHAPLLLLLGADYLRRARRRALLDEASARRLARARDGRGPALVRVEDCGSLRLLRRGRRAAGLRACRGRGEGAKYEHRHEHFADDKRVATHGESPCVSVASKAV